MKKHIPNAITSLNLLCGCIAIINAFEGILYWSAILIFLAAFFDFMDGAVARMLKVSHPLGEQLDSLADVISFGLAPGIILYQFIKELISQTEYPLLLEYPWLVYLVLIIPVFSALRLAKFNIDTRQTDGFIGLATPANASFFISIVLVYSFPEHFQVIDIKDVLIPIFSHPLLLLILSFVFSFLLVSEIPMFSLKAKSLSWKGNEQRFIFLALFIVMLFLFSISAIPLLILLYIIWSVLSTFLFSKKG